MADLSHVVPYDVLGKYGRRGFVWRRKLRRREVIGTSLLGTTFPVWLHHVPGEVKLGEWYSAIRVGIPARSYVPLSFPGRYMAFV